MTNAARLPWQVKDPKSHSWSFSQGELQDGGCVSSSSLQESSQLVPLLQSFVLQPQPACQDLPSTPPLSRQNTEPAAAWMPNQLPRLHNHNSARHSSCWKRKATLATGQTEYLATKTHNNPSALARRNKKHSWIQQGHQGASTCTSPADKAQQHSSKQDPSISPILSPSPPHAG